MFDFRMLLLRLASGFAIYYGATEFFKEPQNLDSLMSGGSELINEVFEWGQNKFLGVPDNSTMIQTKKSARQIYAEAFMEDETNSRFGMGGSQRRFYDEDQPQKPSSVGDEPEKDDIKQESEKEAAEIDDEDDPLDKLTSNEEL
jgi:hypothetical protein